MVVNENLSRFRLLDVDDINRLWLDLDTLLIIDFQTITDDGLEALFDAGTWVAQFATPISTKQILFGGTFFNDLTEPPFNPDFLKLNAATDYESINNGIVPFQTTPQGNALWFEDFYEPILPFPEGNLTSIFITQPRIEYVGGTLPSYLESLKIEGTGLLSFDFIGGLPGSLIAVILADNNLNQATVDIILKELDNAGANNGTVDLTGINMAAPSPSGMIRVDNLLNKGWTVNTN